MTMTELLRSRMMGNYHVRFWRRAERGDSLRLANYLTAVSWKLAACSPCGTHLPAERLGFLARAERVYGVFDGDEAGRAAAARFAEQLGARWRPLHLPDGHDLNDLGRRSGGRAEFFRLLAAVRRAERENSSHGG